MKKLSLFVVLLLLASGVRAQLLPSVQVGLKAGANLSRFSTDNTLNSDNRAGWLGGIWARVAIAGFHIQPELYYTSKSAVVKSSASSLLYENKVTFKSIDVPILLGFKVGAAGIGGRVQTGPVISFITSQDQDVKQALGSALTFDYKDQAYAWQFGLGLDVRRLGVDLRYELGLSNLNDNNLNTTKIRMFNLSLSYRLF